MGEGRSGIGDWGLVQMNWVGGYVLNGLDFDH